jgi:AcrR family transcriptional regulator
MVSYMAEKSAKSAGDWVNAAFLVLAKKGAAAVRVEPLAKQLRVTKGSFYWHFKDRADLLAQILTEWERRATSQVIALVDEKGGSPRERLQHLMVITATHPQAAPIEQAIRAWGAQERSVRNALERVDQRRIAYVRDLLVASGVKGTTALHRSKLMYLALIGEYAVVSHGGELAGPLVWQELIRLATEG